MRKRRRGTKNEGERWKGIKWEKGRGDKEKNEETEER